MYRLIKSRFSGIVYTLLVLLSLVPLGVTIWNSNGCKTIISALNVFEIKESS